MAKLTYQEIRGLVHRELIELLAQNKQKRHGGWQYVGNALHKHSDSTAYANEDNHTTVSQVMYDLTREGIIVPGMPGNFRCRGGPDWSHFHITDHGVSVLSKSTEYLPYDPEGYLKQIASDCPGIDPAIKRYVGEALYCLRQHCLFAADVMLGCASEQAFELLVEAVGNAIEIPADKQRYKSDTKDWQISVKYSKFRPWIDSDKSLPKGPGGLRGGLDANLGATFNVLREARNAAGHPTGIQLTDNEVRQHLLLLGSYLKFIYKLLDHYKSNPYKK